MPEVNSREVVNFTLLGVARKEISRGQLREEISRGQLVRAVNETRLVVPLVQPSVA